MTKMSDGCSKAIPFTSSTSIEKRKVIARERIELALAPALRARPRRRLERLARRRQLGRAHQVVGKALARPTTVGNVQARDPDVCPFDREHLGDDAEQLDQLRRARLEGYR